MAGQPKPAFYVVLGLVVVALIAFGVWRFMPKTQNTGKDTAPDIVLPVQKGKPEVVPPTDASGKPIDDLMFKGEINWVPEERLPPVPGVSAYKPLDKTIPGDKTDTVRFAINVWAGWAPIILANDGFKAGKVWKTAEGKEFKVELALIDNPVVMRDAYANGEVHIGWGTLDMVPLFLQSFVDKEGKPRDPRVMPRIFQQIDWSNGGDGIVVRKDIKSVADLRGKKVVLAQNSPSHYFLLNVLLSAGIQPRDVNMIFTKDAFQAAAAFNADPKISGCVSWAPDIYKLTQNEKGPNKMLVTTAQANKMITDIWFARADFSRDHPDIIESLVRGIFDAMEEMKDTPDKKNEATRKKAAELMGKGYEIPAEEAANMFGDAHNTNVAENREFFLNVNNPTNFARVWNTAYMLYSHPQLKIIDHKQVGYDQVMDFSIIKKLAAEDKYKNQKDESAESFAPKAAKDFSGVEDAELLSNRFLIKFYPNSADLNKKIIRQKDGKDVEELYDPNIDKVLEEIARVAGTFGRARILIVGHTDASMKSRVAPADLPALEEDVKKLSKDRADAVKQALIEKFKIPANQLTTDGKGWDQPADRTDPNNHALNRRVEVKVYTLEAAQ